MKLNQNRQSKTKVIIPHANFYRLNNKRFLKSKMVPNRPYVYKPIDKS